MSDLTRIAVFGANGSIGSAFIQSIHAKFPNAQIHAFARSTTSLKHLPCTKPYRFDIADEEALKSTAQAIKKDGSLDLVFVASGILHSASFQPEKTYKSLDHDAMHAVYEANTVVPAIILKHFLPALAKDRAAWFGAISARVGSISDNRLGGWYTYRASKAALNMLIKCASIELARTHPQACIAALHPGTVASALSEPFQRSVPEGKLFTPEYSADCMLETLLSLRPAQSGRCFAYDGNEIAP